MTLGTRVRVEIMKAMAKCFANEKEIMYVSAFSSRPMLHLRPKESGSRTFGFQFWGCSDTLWDADETGRSG